MIQVTIPSQREAPPAIKYMLDLGDKRLSHAELDQLEREIKVCQIKQHLYFCFDCPYVKQCARLFDIKVDREKW